jgi:phosphomannomutase
VLRSSRSSFAELLRPLRRYPGTGEINFKVEDKPAMIARLTEVFHDGAVDHLDGVTVEYPDWWFNVRPSNTEPFLRLVLEARTQALLEEGKRRVLAVLGSPEGAEPGH